MGMIWIIYPIFCVFMALCGVMLAEAKGRSRLLWGFLGLLFNVVAILVLGFLPRLTRVQHVPPYAEAATVGAADASPPVGILKPVGFGELPKPHPDQVWAMLAEYDPAVRAAIMELRPYGEDAIARLRDAHLTLRDPGMLPDIVARIRSRRPPPVGKGAPLIDAPPQRGPAQSGNGQRDIRDVREERGVSDRRPPEFSAREQASSAMAAAGLPIRASDGPPTGRTGMKSRPAALSQAAFSEERPVYAGDPPAKLGTPAANGGTGRPPIKSGAPANAANGRPASRPTGMNGAGAAGLKSAPLHADDDVLELGGALPTSRVKSAAAAVAVATSATTTEVVEKDLDQANYVGEHKGVHLFKLRDGRVYIDRFAAVPNIDDARRMIDAGLPLPV